MKTKRLARNQKTVKLGLQTRSFVIEERAHGSDDDGEIVEFSFSSETPYERHFGLEILGHKKTEVDLSQLNDGAPFLKDHDTRIQIGVVEKAWLASKTGRVRARFGKSGAAEEERVEVSGRIRTKVSVGYLVNEMVLEKTVAGLDQYRVTRWTPLEVSTVAIPADGTVGIGREAELPALAERADAFAQHKTQVSRLRVKGKNIMLRVALLETGEIKSIRAEDFDEALHLKLSADAPIEMDAARSPEPRAQVTGLTESDVVRISQKAALDSEKSERSRIENITKLGSKFNASDKASKAIGAGVTFAEFREELWLAGDTPGGKTPTGQREYPSIEGNPNETGMSTDEAQNQYSILRACQSIVFDDPSLAPFEREVSASISSKDGVGRPRGLFMPRELLGAPLMPRGSEGAMEAVLRAVTAGTTGGNMISTNLLASSFIDILRNRSVVLELGATMLPGLVGDTDITRQITSGAASWVAESGSAVDADLTLDLVSLRPKTLTAKSKITRRMMLQATPSIEALVRADLASAIALGIDSAAISGSGAGAIPQGILNMPGVGAGLSLGANGGAQSWRNQVELVRAVKSANADQGSLGWAVSTNAWAHLMARPKSGTGENGFILAEPGDRSIGRRMVASEQVPSNLVKAASGTILSAIIYGAWDQLLIGEWGSMDLFPDIYTDGDEGATILRVFQDADIKARHEDAFAASQEVNTTT
jgi:HK97 family phage major capsid protein